MSITFPVNHPASPGFSAVTMRAVPVVGRSRSPFTGAQQVQKHPGQWWEADCQLPPLARDEAQYWIAWRTKLNGLQGSFYLTPPGQGTPLGTATGTPLVKGASQTGNELITDGWTANVTGILKAGDYFQLGTGSNARLHMVLNDADSDGSGDATLDIWPDLRESPNDNDPLVVTEPVGVFALAGNDGGWDIRAAMIYGLSFSAREVL